MHIDGEEKYAKNETREEKTREKKHAEYLITIIPNTKNDMVDLFVQCMLVVCVRE